MKRALLLCFLLAGASVVRGDEIGDLVKILRDGRLPAATPAADWYRPIGVDGVEIRGVLQAAGMPELRRDFPPHYMAYLLTGLDGTVMIDGKMVTLDFGANPELRRKARALHGKRVLLHGRIESRRIPLDEMREALRRVEYIVVTDIEDAGEYLRETTEVEVIGHLDLDTGTGFAGPIVHIGGRTFVLDPYHMGGVDIATFRGKVVRLRGIITGWEQAKKALLPGHPCFPGAPVLQPTSIDTVDHPYIKEGTGDLEIGGWVFQARHILFGRAATGVTVAGRTYWLDFGASDERFHLAGKAMVVHNSVRVRGRLRGSDGAFEVTGIEVVSHPDRYRESRTVEIKGFLQEHPRPDCVPEFLPELAIYPPFRTLQINVNGKAYVLSFPADRLLYRLAYDNLGSTVVVRGRLSGGSIDVVGLEPTVDVPRRDARPLSE
ncbi:MAG: hypothetical protein U0793_27915 [Gemmataceae bacterium]